MSNHHHVSLFNPVSSVQTKQKSCVKSCRNVLSWSTKRERWHSQSPVWSSHLTPLKRTLRTAILEQCTYNECCCNGLPLTLSKTYLCLSVPIAVGEGTFHCLNQSQGHWILLAGTECVLFKRGVPLIALIHVKSIGFCSLDLVVPASHCLSCSWRHGV